MKVIYLAHPVSGDVPGNLAEARRWIRWLYDHVPSIAIVATWITGCEVLDDGNPEHHKLGLQHDVAVIGRCDAILLVGPKLSAGMQAELLAAETSKLHVLSFIGYDRVSATASLIRWQLSRHCDFPRCAELNTHMEHFHHEIRGWCDEHTPWSEHGERCPDPCKQLLASVPA